VVQTTEIDIDGDGVPDVRRQVSFEVGSATEEETAELIAQSRAEAIEADAGGDA
jgi:hypothetical protein